MKKRETSTFFSIVGTLTLMIVGFWLNVAESTLTIDIGTLQTGYPSLALAVNEKGQVAGYSDTDEGRKAFLWTLSDGMEDLGNLGGDITLNMAINENGLVMGNSNKDSSGYSPHAFVARPGEMIGILPDYSYSHAVDMNNNGKIVGRLGGEDDVGWWQKPFLWTPEILTVFDEYVFYGGAPFAWAINDQDQIAIRVYEKGAVFNEMRLVVKWSDSEIGEYGPDSFQFNKGDMNENGEVVFNSVNGHAQFWSHDLWLVSDDPIDLGSLDPTNYDSSYAHAINDRAEVVGTSYVGVSTSPLTSRGFYWTRENPTILNLGTLTDDHNDSDAYDINNFGQVVGTSRVIELEFPYEEVNSRGVLWQYDEETETFELTELPPLSGYEKSRAHTITNTGHVIGISYNGSWLDDDNLERRATLWRIPPPPISEEYEEVFSEIEVLVTGGSLDQGDADVLISMLWDAAKKSQEGKAKATCNKINAFENHVTALVNSGRLTFEEGQELIDEASAICVES